MRELEVYIANKELVKNRFYGITTLILPATQDAISDALYRAEVKNNEAYNIECCSGWPEFLEQIINNMDKKSLEEVNLLAYQVAQMDKSEIQTLEGAIQLREEENTDVPVTIKEVINLAYNLDCYEYHPYVKNDFTLGSMALENNLLDTISGLSEDVLELLDLEKVGQEMRRCDMGTFTKDGYILPNRKAHQELYDGIHLPEIPDMPKGVISVQLVSADKEQEDGVWLELPASKDDMKNVLKQLGENSFDNCLIKESVSSAFPYELAGDEDIQKLNTLAQKIQEFPDQKMLAKFKAVLELELCNDIDFALDVTENLDCYDYDSEIRSPAAYAEYLFKEAGFDTNDYAFSMFDFRGYGERVMEKAGHIQTNYGVISRNETAFIPNYSKTQGMQMGGM